MWSAECEMRSDKHQNLKDRTKAFAADIVRLVQTLPHNRAAWTIGDQLIRSGTSVGANYRAACRARSRREFIAKLGIVEEEADESIFWLEIMMETGVGTPERVIPLGREANELLSITISSIRTARMAPSSTPHSALGTPHSSRSAFRVPRS